MPAKVWFMGEKCPEGKWGPAEVGVVEVTERRLAAE